MARDYAKHRGTHAGRREPTARRKQTSRSGGSGSARAVAGWRWYGAGVLTGAFLSFLVYLGTLPSGEPGAPGESGAPAATPAPEPRFDFYTLLPEQSLDEDFPAGDQPRSRTGKAEQAPTYFLLQAGSFRQREDADRRRAELLLLGLEPTIQESESDNGHWFRVYLGPFASHSGMARARSLTAAQGIDTLLLKREG